MGAVIQNPPLVAKIIDIAPRSQLGGADFNYPIGDPNTPCKSWNCKWTKFGHQCKDPGDGSGLYNSLATCQGHCHEAFQDLTSDDGLGSLEPFDPGTQSCNAIMTLSNHDPINSSGTITINFSGGSDYAFELKGPDPTGNINTLISSGPMIEEKQKEETPKKMTSGPIIKTESPQKEPEETKKLRGKMCAGNHPSSGN